VLLALGHDGHHGALVRRGHAGARRGQTRTHDVRSTEDKADGSLVHLLHGHEVGKLVQEPQSGHPGAIAMAEEHLFAGSVQQEFDVVMAAVGMGDQWGHMVCYVRVPSYHLAMRYESFLGRIRSMWLSNLGYASSSLARMPFCTDDFSCWMLEMLSFSSNLARTEGYS